MQKRILAFILVLCMVVGMLPAFAANDLKGHWAATDITYLNERGIMGGYPDGSFRPDNPIKKGEFIKLLNYTFGYYQTASINYSDVTRDKWYYNEIAKAEAAGYMFVFSGKVKPEEGLTREEAAAMLGRVLGLSSTAPSSFVDASDISSWAKSYVTAVAEEGIITGYVSGKYQPKKVISRAEVARILYNVIGSYYDYSGTFTNSVSNNATVTATGVTLRNMTIPGNLYITESVGNGRVTLDNVVVGGEILTIGSPACTLVLSGANTSAEIASEAVTVRVSSPIAKLEMSNSYKTAAVAVDTGADIGMLVLNGPAKVTGSGTIKQAQINASGSTLEQRPEKWTLKTGVSATIAGTYTTSSGSGSADYATGYPTATSTNTAYGTSTIEVKAMVTKPCNLYYIAVASGSTAPTAQQVKAMQNYGLVTVYKSNMTQATSTTGVVVATLTGLASSQAYDVWVVTEDLSNGTLGTPVKVSPETPVFTEGYPVIQSIAASQVTVSVQVTKNTTMYWAAIPKNTSIVPTAEQIINKNSNALGAVYGLQQVYSGYPTSVSLSGLVLGTAAYDYYIVTKDAAGTVAPKTPVQLVTASTTGTTMTVSYSQTANLAKEYPVYTTITMTFSKDMYLKNSSMLMSFLGSQITSCMTVEKTNVATGAKTAVTDYNVYIADNKQITIAPPAAGWSPASVYTVSINGLTSADSTAPTPASFEFITTGAGSVIAPPVASVESGSSVSPGETITLTSSTTGAVIQYAVGNGSDPTGGAITTGYGTGTTVTIPSNWPAGTQYYINAVTRLNNEYSSVVTLCYTIGYGSALPQLKSATGLTIPSGADLTAGSYVYLTASDASARIYYTLDGTTPTISSLSVLASANTPIMVQGAAGTKMTIKAVAVRENGGSQIYSNPVTFEIDIAAGTGANKPVFGYNGAILDTASTVPVNRAETLLIESVGSAATQIIYTVNDNTNANPATSASRQVAYGQSATIRLAELPWGTTNYVIRAVAYNAATGAYSDVATITLWVMS